MVKKVTGRYRFRLMLGLPVVVACFTLAAGFYPLGMIDQAVATGAGGAELKSLILGMKFAVLLTALAATTLAVLITAYIVQPVQKIVSEMNALASQRELGEAVDEPQNEIEALSTIYRRALLPLKGYLASADLFMQMSEGVVGVDRDGKIALLNGPAQQLLQIERSDYVGKAFTTLFPNGNRNSEIHSLIQEAMSGASAATRDIVITTVANRDLFVRVTASPASARGTEPKGAVLLFKGFEEFGRLKKELQRIDTLAALGGSVTGMAHEVRTPLGYIRSLAELLREDLAKDSKQQEYVSTIIESTDRLNNMVGSILSLARVQVTEMSVQDPVTLAREAIAYSRPSLQTSDLKLVEDYPQSPCLIKADRDRLMECFINLFNNACEASEPGGTVTVRVRPVAPHTVIVEFHNHGSTIAAEDIDRLFVPFFTTKKQGTGLGLPISKQIIEAHGGAIRVESDRREGTLFRVILPLQVETS